MGGGPLTILMSSLHKSKVAIRTNIAFVYLFFGISQIIILVIFRIKSFDSSYFILPLIAIASYLLIGRNLSARIDDKRYQTFITVIIIIYGLLAFIDIGSMFK
jgi:uncharacterized membrane protein YfcA